MGIDDWQEVSRKNNRYRTKEDDVIKISISIYVSNFPESFSAKDLFHACSKYGHVVDSFIPSKRSKEGKRFGFVRFINVFSAERLVGNLCTIWIGRCKLQANIARFDRSSLNNRNTYDPRKNVRNSGTNVVGPNGGSVGNENTFANVLSKKPVPMSDVIDSQPVIVLDDDCVQSQDLTLSLMGKVKEFASLTNIKSALCNEGFTDLNIRYLGEFWVLLEFKSLKVRDLFCENVGVKSWFSEITPASVDFCPDGRIPCIESLLAMCLRLLETERSEVISLQLVSMIRSDRCVNNNVVDISSSDDEIVVALTHKKNVDDHIEKDETMDITSMCLTTLQDHQV
ncbi:nucleotide-binding alpha-beta plait domain-containing protein [Tanacetum coccineum]